MTVGNDPGTGKPIRRSICGNTQKEVLTAMRDVLSMIDEAFARADAPDTFAQWLDIWQSDYLLSQKYGTVKTYKAQIATHQTGPRCCEAHQAHAAPRSRLYNDLLANGAPFKTGTSTARSSRKQRHGHGDCTTQCKGYA